jgi:TonB family protein
MTKQFNRYLATVAFMSLGLIVQSGGSAALAEDGVVHVSQAEALRAVKDRIQPEYPPMARQLHLQGAVHVEAHIGESGAVEDVKALTGNAVLMNAAIAAIRRWKFTPFTADGKPSKAIADLSFDFKM